MEGFLETKKGSLPSNPQQHFAGTPFFRETCQKIRGFLAEWEEKIARRASTEIVVLKGLS